MKKKVTMKGFTLAELLISSAIFMVVSTIIVSSLFAAFRLSKKSDTLTLAKQNGNAAMAQMVRGIRYAKSLDDPPGCALPETVTEITITSSTDKAQTVYSCPADSSGTIASNSASLLDTTAVKVVYCSFSCYQASAISPPTITIQFTLTNADEANFVESTARVPFQTSVTMRNFSR